MKVEPIGVMEQLSVRQEPSRAWDPMRRAGSSEWGEEWRNAWYGATVRRSVKVLGVEGVCIGISNTDQSAAHDWRDFQRIKNDIVGEEWEAVELYPAESRMIDPSNYFYLWCAPKGVFEFGLPGQRLVQAPGRKTVAPQRPFAGGRWEYGAPIAK